MTLPLAYLTDNIGRIEAARKIAKSLGRPLHVLPPDAPLPQAGRYAGVVVDLAGAARHALARRQYLDNLAALAGTTPVGVHDLTTTPAEAGFFRDVGIRWAPSLRRKLFADTLARGVPDHHRPALTAEEVEQTPAAR